MDISCVHCTLCNAGYSCTPEYLESFNQGIPPGCPECSKRGEIGYTHLIMSSIFTMINPFDHTAILRQARSARPMSIGSLRPSIVLYDEAHPQGDEIGHLSTRDQSRRPDILIVMGTSLQVHGLKQLVKDFADAVHQQSPINARPTSHDPPDFGVARNILSAKKPRVVIFINRTAPAKQWGDVIDFWVKGETDEWAKGCERDWRSMRPQDWEIQPKSPDTVKRSTHPR